MGNTTRNVIAYVSGKVATTSSVARWRTDAVPGVAYRNWVTATVCTVVRGQRERGRRRR